MRRFFFLASLLVILGSTPTLLFAKAKPAHRHPKTHVLKAEEEGLVDFSQEPFSDLGSHMTLLRRSDLGLGSWDILSARAFGSLAAHPHPAKLLANIRVEAEVAGAADPLFPKGLSVTADDEPRWASMKVEQEQISGEVVVLYPETDCVVYALSIVNHSNKSIRVRPRFLLSGGAEGVDSSVKLDRNGVLTLNLDRSKLVERELIESLCLYAGTPKVSGIFSVASMQNAQNLMDSLQVGTGGYTVSFSPQAFSTLKPGQGLRLPLVLSLALKPEDAAANLGALWTRWAQPKGEALAKAEARWSLTESHLPHALDPKYERLSHAASLALLMSQYSKRSELKSDMFSEAKGYDDAFFSTSLPLAALGWGEIDFGTAEDALLELSSFSAAAPAAVPPYTGEELLLWKASGLPLHGLVAWELFQRDPNLARADSFIKAFGLHLRNECAWWPPNRDGDGNGLYAFANQEERPWYQVVDSSGKLPVADDSLSPSATLQTYNIALTALVAWQMQMGAAMASEAEDKDEAAKLLAEYQHIAGSLKKNTRAADGTYEQGLDGLWPYALGLDQDLGPARNALGQLTRSASSDALPFIENGLFHPWRAYYMLRCLALYGDQDLAEGAAAKILAFLDGKGIYSAYHSDGSGLGAPGDVATAAAILEMALGRYEEESYLLADTTSLRARLLSFHSPDGSFYMKRIGLEEHKAPYALISLKAPQGGKILDESAFILNSEEPIKLSLISKTGLDITEQKGKRQLFVGTKHAELIIHPKSDYLITIEK